MFGQGLVVEAEKETETVETAVTMVQFGSDGDASNIGRSTVQQAGFKEGGVVTPSKICGAEQSIISRINGDGSVLLQPILKDGSVDADPTKLSTVALNEFLEGYKKTVQIQLDTRAPFLESDGFRMDSVRSVAFQALYRHAQEMPSEQSLLRVQQTPSRAVYALAGFSAGKQVCMPCTDFAHLMAWDEKEDARSHFNILVTSPDNAIQKLQVMQSTSKSHVSLAFCIKVTDNQEQADLQLTHIDVGMPVWAAKGARYTVSLPVITTSKAIGVDEELLLHIAAKEKKESKKRSKVLAMEDDKYKDMATKKKAKKDKKA